MSDEPKPTKMTASELKAARKQLGMSISELAQMLRMGSGGARKVQRFEAGDEPVTGPVSVAVEALISGWRPGNS